MKTSFQTFFKACTAAVCVLAASVLAVSSASAQATTPQEVIANQDIKLLFSATDIDLDAVRIEVFYGVNDDTAPVRIGQWTFDATDNFPVGAENVSYEADNANWKQGDTATFNGAGALMSTVPASGLANVGDVLHFRTIAHDAEGNTDDKVSSDFSLIIAAVPSSVRAIAIPKPGYEAWYRTSEETVGYIGVE